MTTSDNSLVALSSVKTMLGLSRSGHNTEQMLSIMEKHGVVPVVSMPFAKGTARYYRRDDVLARGSAIKRDIDAARTAPGERPLSSKEYGKIGGEKAWGNVHSKLDDIIARLERLESMWTAPTVPPLIL